MPSIRFVPTDEELIADFLKPHVLSGRPLQCDDIRVTDVYAKDPWELVGDREEEAYFITRRSRMTKGSSRPQRTVPSGTWKMEKQVDVADESGAVIGRKALLSFHFEKKRKASGWLMHEFLLCSVADDDERVAFQETALCCIRGKRGRRQGGAIAKRIKNSLGEDEPSSSSVTTTATVSHHPPQFLDVGSSLMQGSEKEMMVSSPQSVLEHSPPSSISVQSPQQEEDNDVDVAPPLASNPICERGDQEDGGGGDHKVSAVVGGFTDFLLGPDEDGDQQLAAVFNQMTTEQWDMFCNYGAGLEGSTSTAMATICDQSAAAATSVAESMTIDRPEIALGDADRATTSELPTILSETTASANEGSTELLGVPEFFIWDFDLEEITEVPPLETTEGDRQVGHQQQETWHPWNCLALGSDIESPVTLEGSDEVAHHDHAATFEPTN